MTAPRVNDARLHQSLDEMAQIGATPGGGVTRLALSPEDKAGRDLLRQWMEEANLRVRVDDFGNMIGERAGEEDLPPLLLASHLDSVRQGGRYDGAYGVLGALEVIRSLNDHQRRTRHPVAVVNWTNEEGVRFEPAMLCSGAIAGRFERDYVYGRTDRDGHRFEDELRRIGYAGEEGARPTRAAGYLELHIEQGPILESEEIPVGIVQGIVGITWLDICLTGRADHAGPSPMALRRDALVAAAKLVTGVDAIARATEGAVGTVGRLNVEPNSINTIPGQVVMSVDFRHPSSDVLEALVQQLRQSAAAIEAASGVTIAIDRFWTSEPTPFDSGVLAAVEAAANTLEIATRPLWSSAGHDAKYLQEICPAAMIFVRSRDGLSHCETEFSTLEDLAAGANVLLGATLQLAGAVSSSETG